MGYSGLAPGQNDHYGVRSAGRIFREMAHILVVTQPGFVCIFFRFGGRKLWSGSVEPSPAALIRAAFNFSNPRGMQKEEDANASSSFW